MFEAGQKLLFNPFRTPGRADAAEIKTATTRLSIIGVRRPAATRFRWLFRIYLRLIAIWERDIFRCGPPQVIVLPQTLNFDGSGETLPRQEIPPGGCYTFQICLAGLK